MGSSGPKFTTSRSRNRLCCQFRPTYYPFHYSAAIRLTNGTYELRISPTAGGKKQIAAFGTEPAFSSDSRWVAYAVGVSAADEDKLKKAKKPVQLKWA